MALHLGNSLFQEGKHVLAWSAWEPVLGYADQLNPAAQLSIAGMAYSASAFDDSRKLLKLAFDSGIESIEELSAAATLSYQLREDGIFDTLLGEMSCLAPDAAGTSRLRFLRLFRERRFVEAMELAEECDFALEAEQCRAFLSPHLSSEEFLRGMKDIGEEDQGLISCAEEALFRQYGVRAIVWARKVPEGSSFYEKACITRVRALRVVFRKGALRYGTAELESLMAIVARSPHTVIRSELERLLEDGMEEPLATAILAHLLFDLIAGKSSHDKDSIEEARRLAGAYDFTKGAKTFEEVETFREELGKSFREEKTLIGSGKLPEELVPLVGPTLVILLAQAVDELAKVDQSHAVELLHALCLCCNVIGDPDTDFKALLCLVDVQASTGSPQMARDLADTALGFWPRSQPQYLTWRTAQGWAALAEACLRSKNTLAACRYLIQSLLAHPGPALDVELLRKSYRMAARIYRDLGLRPLSLACIEFERNLLATRGGSDGKDISLEILELQIALPRIVSSGIEEMLNTLDRTEQLFNAAPDTEIFPLMGIQASILRYLPSESIPPGIDSGFLARLPSIPESLRSELRFAISRNPTKEEVTQALESLPYAQDHRYLSFQIASALPGALNALHSSVGRQDSELFLVASSAFSQPCLNVRIADSDTNQEVNSDSAIRTTTMNGLKSGSLEAVEKYSYLGLGSGSIQQLRDSLDEDEMAIVLAGEPGKILYQMMVTKSEVSAPQIATGWSEASLDRWRGLHLKVLNWSYPANYLSGFDRLLPPLREILSFFDGLSIGPTELPPKLLIIPPSFLFGFSWMLSKHGTGFLCEKSKVSVAPSVDWLIRTRGSTWSGPPTRKAWIGSSEMTDPTLSALRGYVEGALNHHAFSLCHETAPWGFENCELAFIGAHGGTGISDHFRSVSDRMTYFSPRELARLLGGCGCVILAVCSGGRSDRQRGSEEVNGLVSELLRAGVRTVIAAPWPLDIDVVKYWLPAFLESFDSGRSVGDAAAAAAGAVGKNLDHPCAWGHLHVYGDESFTKC